MEFESYDELDILFAIGVIIANNIVLENKNNNTKPKLYKNIATSVYGEYFGLDSYSEEASILTGFINNFIVNVCYQDKVKYEKPIGDYIREFGELQLEENIDGTYKMSYFQNAGIKPNNLECSIDELYVMSIDISSQLVNNKKNKLLNNIAFSKYNEYLGLNPLSRDAALITGIVNSNIINTYYNDCFEYEVTDKEKNKRL